MATTAKQYSSLGNYQNELIFRTRILLIVVYIIVAISGILILNKVIFDWTVPSANRIRIEIGLAMALVPFAYYLSGVLLKFVARIVETQRMFISTVNHELQNPISIMKLNSEIALSQKPSPDEIIETVRNNIEELNNLSERLKILTTLAAHNYGLGKIPFSQIDLGFIAKKVVALVSEQFGREKNVNISFSADPAVEISGNAVALEEMIFNLVKNAALYTPENGSISVSVLNKGRFIELIVKDTGVGISKKDLPYIFHPFYRASETTGSGSGLGLAIVREIAKHHQAEIKTDSKMGRGTKITVRFPNFIYKN